MQKGGPVHETRVLRSDVVFIRSPGTALPWQLLRDVYEVDGAVVRDRQKRLETLLLGESSGPARARAGHRRRGRAVQPGPCLPQLQRPDAGADVPSPVGAAALRVREPAERDDRRAALRGDRLLRAGLADPDPPGRRGPRRAGERSRVRRPLERHRRAHRAVARCQGRRNGLSLDPHDRLPRHAEPRTVGARRDAGRLGLAGVRVAGPLRARSSSSTAARPTAASGGPRWTPRRAVRRTPDRASPLSLAKRALASYRAAAASAGAGTCCSKSRTSVSSIFGSSPVKTPMQTRSCGRIFEPQ